MFLKCHRRRKDGKEHRYWSVVENRRAGGSVIQRQVLYLGEINDSQREAWKKAVSVFDEQKGVERELAIYPADQPLPELPQVVGWECDWRRWLCAGRGSGARAGWRHLWRKLDLDGFWPSASRPSRKGPVGTRCCKRWSPTG